MRIERDTMGDIDVPADRLWGAQTQRSLHQLPFSRRDDAAEVVHAQVLVKKAAALVNMALGVLDGRKGEAIVKAADEALARQARRSVSRWSSGRPAPAPRPT